MPWAVEIVRFFHLARHQANQAVKRRISRTRRTANKSRAGQSLRDSSRTPYERLPTYSPPFPPASKLVLCQASFDGLGATAGLPSSAENTVGQANRGTPQFTTDRALATRSASIMLPVSARRRQAMSKAVPWATLVRMIGSPKVTFTARCMPNSFRAMCP